MIDGVVQKKLRVIPDERGRLMECLRSDDELFLKFGQLYVTTTLPGIVKGWHLHHIQYDNIVCVKGMIKLVLYDGRDDSPTRGHIDEFFMGEHNPLLVRVPPEVQHGWKCVSPDEAFIVNAPTELYHYDDPDQDELPARYRPHPLRLGPAAALTRSPTASSRAATAPLSLETRWFLTGGGGQLASALEGLLDGEVFVAREEYARPARRDRRRHGRALLPARHRAAHRGLHRRRRRRARRTDGLGRERARHAPLDRGRARHARPGRVVFDRLRLRRPQGRAVRRARRTRPAQRLRPHQAGPGARDARLGARHRHTHGLAVLGDGRQLRDDDPGGGARARRRTPRASRCASSTTRSARRPTPATWRRRSSRRCKAVSARASTTWPAAAPAAGASWPARSWRWPACRSRSNRSRRPQAGPAGAAAGLQRPGHGTGASRSRPAGRTAWRPSWTSCSARR